MWSTSNNVNFLGPTLNIIMPMEITDLFSTFCEMYNYSDLLWAGRSGNRILVGVRFSAPIQTGHGVHPASCTIGTGSFPGVKAAGA